MEDDYDRELRYQGSQTPALNVLETGALLLNPPLFSVSDDAEMLGTLSGASHAYPIPLPRERQ